MRQHPLPLQVALGRGGEGGVRGRQHGGEEGEEEEGRQLSNNPQATPLTKNLRQLGGGGGGKATPLPLTLQVAFGGKGEATFPKGNLEG